LIDAYNRVCTSLPNPGIFRGEALRRNGRQDGVDLARKQHIVERLVGDTHALDLRRQLDCQIFLTARPVRSRLDPFDLLELQPGLVHQVAAGIDPRGVREVGVADTLAAELFERVDTAALLDVER